MARKLHKKRGSNAQGKRKRLQLLEASGKCFAKLGYNGTTVRDIAQEANVQPSALIYHFGSKENLFKETLRYHIFDNLKLYSLFDAFENLKEDDPQSISNAIYDTFNAVIHALFGGRKRMNCLSGMMIALLTDGTKEANALVQKMGTEAISKGFPLMRKFNPKITDTDFFWWDHFFYAMILYPVYTEKMILSHTGEKKFSEEFLESYVRRACKICCFSTGLPLPSQMSGPEKWVFTPPEERI